MTQDEQGCRERRALAVLAIVTAAYGLVIAVRPDWRYGGLLPLALIWMLAGKYTTPIGLSLRMSLPQIYGAIRRGEVPRPTATNKAIQTVAFVLFAFACYHALRERLE